jgi:3-deoxy-D-manno-octulosonic-acid transferase
MRLFYTLCFYLAVPLIFIRLLWRARSASAYGQRWNERFGLFPARAKGKKAIWIHSVSVGETLAALPMIKALQERYPAHDLVVTTMTPTGSERVTASLGDSVFHVYVPYDLPDCVNRFLTRTQPDLAIIMETELWPNILRGCHKRGIPVVVANARMSEKSARGYLRFSGLSAQMLSCVTAIAAQNKNDAERLIRIGADSRKVKVTGSIKFDIVISPDVQSQAELYRARWQGGHQRPVLLAASTHEGEDELVLSAFETIIKTHPNLLLVVVPRHPERFQRVTDLASKDFRVQKHSLADDVADNTQVVIGDTMGEMMALLGACDICFMGGSWVETGGHNLIEPAVWAKPLLSGPSLFNFAEVSDLLLQENGMVVVESPLELAAEVCDLLADSEAANEMGQRAYKVAAQNKGALERLLQLIDQVL